MGINKRNILLAAFLVLIIATTIFVRFYIQDENEVLLSSQTGDPCVTYHDCPPCHDCVYISEGFQQGTSVNARVVGVGKSICVKKCKEEETCCVDQFGFGRCTNLNNDPLNCRYCGNKCPGTLSCINGECGCEPGLTLCMPPGICVDTNNNQNHCGYCDVVCTPFIEKCVNGKCECIPGHKRCDNLCTNINSDPLNCGECRKACSDIINQICKNGDCICKYKEHTLCKGKCVNLNTDFYNCGYCGKKCEIGQICSNGDCVQQSGA